MRKRREMRKRLDVEKDLSLGEKESATEATVPRIEMTVNEKDERDSLELFEQRCDLCNRTWSASIPIICPYCHGKIKKVIPA